MLGRIVLVSVLLLTTAYWLFQERLAAGVPVAEARTAAIDGFVAVEVAYLLNCRSLTGRASDLGLLSNRWLLAGIAVTAVLQLALTYWAPLNAVFGTAPIGPETWALIAVAASVSWLVVEAEKALRRRGGSGRPGLVRRARSLLRSAPPRRA